MSGAATDRLYPRVTFGALPDDVLLETFELYLGKDVLDHISGHNYDGWQTLVHVCRRWRCIVFASPRRLDLKLRCTHQRSVNSKGLDIWPEFPIVIVAGGSTQFNDDATNTINAALRHHSRVCKIDYRTWRFQDSFLKEFAAIDKPFPALTSLTLLSSQQNVTVLPDTFLGGSAPQLRSLYLEGIPYPSEDYFCLPLTLSAFRFGVFLIPDIFHPRRLSPVCPCWPSSENFISDSNTLDLGPIKQADIHPRSLV